MMYFRLAVISILMASSAAFAQERSGVAGHTPFDELLEVTYFIKNYKESAVVSARVLGARNQGSDREYAAFMARVVDADLSDLQACMGRAYAAGPLTVADAEELVRIFQSRIGVRVLDLTQQVVIADIERGFHKPLDVALLGDSERREIALLFQRPVFVRYNAYIASQAQAVSTRACIAASRVGKESGIKF
jgi:hypothetical protein